MRIRLSEITEGQGEMLRRLDDGPARDSVGLHTGDLATDELRRCLELHALGSCRSRSDGAIRAGSA